MPTAVIEPTVVPVRDRPADAPDARPEAQAVPPGAGGRSRDLTWALAALAVLAVVVLYGVHALRPGRGDAMAARARPDGPDRRDVAGRSLPHRAPPQAIVDGRMARPARRLRLLVPAYIYPGGEGRQHWRRLIDAAGRVDLVLVVNPDSGPGAERDTEYASAIAEAAASGVQLVGYVNLTYGRRPAVLVKDDIDHWIRHYPGIGGFFLDQQPTDARFAAYFADIAAHARNGVRDAMVIGNPGVPCDESFLARGAADTVCIFAKPDGFDAFELPGNLKGYDPSHLAALVYQVPDARAMRGLLKDAIIKRIGYFYVTDGRSPNPWGRVPAYWDDEVEAVARLQ
jgi:hypothetical protein